MKKVHLLFLFAFLASFIAQAHEDGIALSEFKSDFLCFNSSGTHSHEGFTLSFPLENNQVPDVRFVEDKWVKDIFKCDVLYQEGLISLDCSHPVENGLLLLELSKDNLTAHALYFSDDEVEEFPLKCTVNR